MRKIAFLFLFLFLFLVSTSFGQAVIAPDLQKALDNNKGEQLRVIVTLKEKLDVKSILATHDLKGSRRQVKGQVIEILKVKSAESQKDIREFIENMSRSGGISNVYYFWLTNAISLVTDPNMIQQIALRQDVESINLDQEQVMIQPMQGTPQRDAWGVPFIKADKVWELGINGSEVIVAVTDTGINLTHPEFAPGQVLVALAKSFVDSEADAEDGHGHGTHCAGTIGSAKYGVAPGVKFVPVKVLSKSGSGTWTGVINGVQYAVQNADVVSMSLGGSAPYAALEDPIRNAINGGTVFCIAAGNSGPSAKTIGTPGVVKEAITVAAIDNTNTIASFSSRGPSYYGDEKPDIAAPGVNITSLYKNGGTTTMSGTSMATPHVAGLAALILSKNPDLSPDKVKELIMSNTFGAQTPNVTGKGTVDALAAVSAVKEGIEITITPVGEIKHSTQPFAYTPSTEKSREIDPTQIINIAKQIWEFIKENQPVVNTQYDFATAVPGGTTTWAQLANWKGPSSRDYRLVAKNLYGMTVVDFTYRVMWTWGGDYEGKGKYLTNCTAVPVNLWVAWGYTFDSKVQVPQVYNVGSSSDPIAAMQLIVSWKVHTIVTHSEGAGTYEVRGNGEFKEIGK